MEGHRREGLVGEPLKLVAETKDMEEGSGVTFTVYEEKSGRKVAETGATVKDGKAEAEWRAVDMRNADDAEALVYCFTARAARCRAVQSEEVRVKNPRIISIEWDKKAIYYGDKATLKIKTFELCDESPVCKLQLWEKDFTTEDDFILEQDITINSDEVEQAIEFKFKLIVNSELETVIVPVLLYKDRIVETSQNENSEILVGTGFINKGGKQ